MPVACTRGDFVMRPSKTMAIEAAGSGEADLPRLALASRRLQDWMRSGLAGLATCADYFHAAAMYEALRGLSPAELERRGFSRGSLARDLCGLDDNSVA